MSLYLQSLGWWNLVGSVLIFFFLNEKIGNAILVKWGGLFKEEFTHNFYSRLWICWAAGMNIFFALVNIYSPIWNVQELMNFIVYFDIISYSIFVFLVIRTLVNKTAGVGMYLALLIFLVWIGWGISTLL